MLDLIYTLPNLLTSSRDLFIVAYGAFLRNAIYFIFVYIFVYSLCSPDILTMK